MTSMLLHICVPSNQTMTVSIHPTQSDYKENEMLFCLQSDEQRHFSKFYDRFSAALFGLILNWIKDAEVAENLLQDVFVKAWRSKELYDPSKGRLYTWLYNIARNTCIDFLYSKTFKKTRASLLSADVAMLAPALKNAGLTPDTIGLRKLVKTLRQEEREVIELMYFKGFTQTEIASTMNMPLGTVKTRMSRAIKNLRYFYKKDWKQALQNVSLN